MTDDPLEQTISLAIHEALQETHPQLVRELRGRIKAGWPKETILRIIRGGTENHPNLRRWLETEVDYLIEEHKLAQPD